MSLLVFGVGVLVFFLTVYGTVMAGGLQLTKEQLKTSPDLAPDLDEDHHLNNVDDLQTLDVIRADF